MNCSIIAISLLIMVNRRAKKKYHPHDINSTEEEEKKEL